MKIIFFISVSCSGPSCFREFVVDALQSLAQMQHRIAFAREQRIHAHAGLGGHLLEAASFQFVRHKHLALLLRQFVDRQLELVEKHVAGVKRLRSGIGRRQQIFEPQSSSSSPATAVSLKLSGLFLRKRSVMRLRATRNSQPVTCSIGISRRLASTSS